MNFAGGGGLRSRWVGPSVPAPQQSADRRQRHYGAVELAGSGEQVYVNDVVQVSNGQPSTAHRPYGLVQVGHLCVLS